ncbi:MAG TPA: lytic transglycosylase domain-containing protein, partial [Anaeromyxobacteraceae bacterium]|nr:lytic transglycosylase domain-containing protein [Anaeromyxobacteraceae bacterium]
MRRPSLTGLAGASAAVAVVVTTLLVPAPVAEALRPRAAPERAACTDPERCPEARRELWATRIATQLEARLPVLDELDRDELARTIVDEAVRARIDPLLVLAL